MATSTLREVDSRPLMGWPGTEVVLELTSEGHCFVSVICDENFTEIYNGKDREQARDAFMHPFAFGYTA